MTEVPLFSATYYGMTWHTTAEANTDLLFASEVGFWQGEDKDDLLQNLYCCITMAFFFHPSWWSLYEVYSRLCWTSTLGTAFESPTALSESTWWNPCSSDPFVFTLKESLTPLGFLTPCISSLDQVFPWQGFASRMLNTTLVGADIQNVTPLCKGLWIKICCICKDDRYCFGTSSFQRTLFHIGMVSLLKRQGSSRLLMQSKPTSVLAQVTEQNKIIPLSFLFAPSSTENTKLECQRSWLQHC